MPNHDTSGPGDAFARVPNDPRTLVVDGYGVGVKVHRSHLTVTDGVGPNRRERSIPRIERTVRRIIVLNANGTITFDAVRWCDSVGIPIIYTDIDGSPIMASTGFGSDAALRRAQAFSGEGGPSEDVGLSIVKDILDRKIDGQEANLRTMGKDTPVVAESRTLVADSPTVDECRSWEGRAAGAYWDEWIGEVGIAWSRRDAKSVPEQWKMYASRASLTSGRARYATDPVNAMLNYCYRLAEIECILACRATGLDPELGFLHKDKESRNSLALDLLEVVRPEIDAYVLQLIGRIGKNPRKFSPQDFKESSSGTCRIMPPLTHELAENNIAWAKTLSPLVESYARTISSAANGYVRIGRPTEDKTLMASSRSKQRCKPVPIAGVVTVDRLVPEDVWHQIEPLLPKTPTEPRSGRKRSESRSVLAGIVCVEMLGAAWSRIPRTLGVSRYTCKKRLDEWKRSGLWPSVRDVLEKADIK